MQEPAMTTAASRKNPFSLLVALDGAGSSTGDMYLDDGESLAMDKSVISTHQLNMSRGAGGSMNFLGTRGQLAPLNWASVSIPTQQLTPPPLFLCSYTFVVFNCSKNVLTSAASGTVSYAGHLRTD